MVTFTGKGSIATYTCLLYIDLKQSVQLICIYSICIWSNHLLRHYSDWNILEPNVYQPILFLDHNRIEFLGIVNTTLTTRPKYHQIPKEIREKPSKPHLETYCASFLLRQKLHVSPLNLPKPASFPHLELNEEIRSSIGILMVVQFDIIIFICIYIYTYNYIYILSPLYYNWVAKPSYVAKLNSAFLPPKKKTPSISQSCHEGTEQGQTSGKANQTQEEAGPDCLDPRFGHEKMVTQSCNTCRNCLHAGKYVPRPKGSLLAYLKFVWYKEPCKWWHSETYKLQNLKFSKSLKNRIPSLKVSQVFENPFHLLFQRLSHVKFTLSCRWPLGSWSSGLPVVWAS